MRGYFDSEEPDGEEPQEPGHERRRDTELTLGWGALVGSVFGLVLVCGLSFWLGYAVGHHGSASPPATATQPMTLQLRYLQTLTEIGVEKNTTIVFPLPMELMSLLNKFSAQMKPADKQP